MTSGPSLAARGRAPPGDRLSCSAHFRLPIAAWLAVVFAGAAWAGAPQDRPTVVDTAWPSLPPPGPRDWRTQFPEKPQNFTGYQASRPQRLGRTRRRVELLPLGDLRERHSGLIEAVSEHIGLWVPGARVDVRPAEPVPAEARRGARGPRDQPQLDADALLGRLRRRLPRDALAVVAMTAEDITSADLPYVFGLAWSGDRVAVQSTARLARGPGPIDRDAQLLRRVLRTTSHELAHVLELPHCTFYACLLNGSNTLEEADRTPLFPCPECREKLEHACGFDRVTWYRGLAAYYARHGLDLEARFASLQADRSRKKAGKR